MFWPTKLVRLQKNVADTKANYDAAAKLVMLVVRPIGPKDQDAAAHNAWDDADTKYAAWDKAQLALSNFLKEQEND